MHGQRARYVLPLFSLAAITVGLGAGCGGNSANGGTGGAGGMNGGSGTGGTMVTTTCVITPTADASPKIATVGIVTFTTDVASPSAAHIEFGLDTSYGWSAPVDLAEPSYRTLLLGMKQNKTYHYRVFVESAAGICASDDATVATGGLPNGLPTIDIETGSGQLARGFINSAFFLGMNRGSGTSAFIVDSDGEYVWTYGNGEAGRAEMSYDGKYMYWASVNAMETPDSLFHRVTMDGMIEEDMSAAVSGLHHDFTTGIPDGAVGFIRRIGAQEWVSEWKEGVVTDKFDVGALFETDIPHANSIHYHPDDDTYTVSDRYHNGYIKVTRSGTMVWRLGGTNSSFTGDVTWSVNHGHHFIPPNRMFFFNNGMSAEAHAVELMLDTSTMVATKVWDYAAGTTTPVLGDVQILDNGNRLITFSTAGLIHEVDSTGTTVIQSLSFAAGGTIGYAVKRPTLYGPPPPR